jgi:DNA-binding NarL/FixJ family response regulator
MSDRIRVLVVDDHALVRMGFRRILDDDAGIDVVGEAGSGAEAIEADSRLNPDVVVMDMSMPELDGVHAAIEIKRRHPERAILFLSMYSDEQYVRNAFDAGASGYILKNALDVDLTRAVRVVATGGQYLSPELSSFAIRRMRGDHTETADPYDQLSGREIQVLRLIALGKSNKEIAAILGLSVNTVSVHRANLMNTLGVHKTAELVLIAVKKGLVAPE